MLYPYRSDFMFTSSFGVVRLDRDMKAKARVKAQTRYKTEVAPLKTFRHRSL